MPGFSAVSLWMLLVWLWGEAGKDVKLFVSPPPPPEDKLFHCEMFRSPDSLVVLLLVAGMGVTVGLS